MRSPCCSAAEKRSCASSPAPSRPAAGDEPAVVELDDVRRRAVDGLAPVITRGRRRLPAGRPVRLRRRRRGPARRPRRRRARDRRRRGRTAADPRQPGRGGAGERGAVPHARAPGHHRWAHGAVQPPLLLRAPQPGDRQGAALRASALAAHDRHRRLQALQRPLRAPGGRPGPQGGRPHPGLQPPRSASTSPRATAARSSPSCCPTRPETAPRWSARASPAELSALPGAPPRQR